MEQSVKDRLKTIPKSVCAECGSKRSYGNPMAKCFECKRKFCFDHISGLQVNSKMKQNDEVRSVCAKCIKEYKYKTL